MIESDVTVFPDPLSPTMPSVSPGATENDTPSTTRTRPPAVSKSKQRPSTTSSWPEGPASGADGAARSTVVKPSRPARRLFAPPSAARRPSPTALKQKTVIAMAGRPVSLPTGGRG